MEGQVDKPVHRHTFTVKLEKGGHARAHWKAAGQSTCTLDENEGFKLFDYIPQSSWNEFCEFNEF